MVVDSSRKAGIFQRYGVGLIVATIIAACIGVVLLLTAVVLLTPNPISRLVRNPGYYGHLSEGRQLEKAGDDRGAAQHYAEMIRLRPDWPGGYYYLGNACYRMGRRKEALENYTAALQRHPNAKLRRTLVQYRAYTARKLERYDMAAADYAELARLDPANRLWDTFRLECLLYGKRYRAVIQDANNILAQPGNHDGFAFWIRGNAKGGLRDVQGAVSDLKEATRRDAGNAQPWIDRGWWEYQAGRYRESMESSRTAMILRPTDVTSRFNRALCEALLGQNTQALADYEGAAHAASAEQRRDALAALKGAIRRNPKALPVLTQAARLIDERTSNRTLAAAPE